MEDEDIASNMYIQLIQSVWAESRASTTKFLARNIVVVMLA